MPDERLPVHCHWKCRQPRRAGHPRPLPPTASAQVCAVVGGRIRDERRAHQLTIRALAAKARLSPAAVQSIESGPAGSVLHELRLRTETFRALCPSEAAAFDAWWNCTLPKSGLHSCLVVLDPTANPRQRQWIELSTALTARPRHRGYAGAASAMMAR